MQLLSYPSLSVTESCLHSTSASSLDWVRLSTDNLDVAARTIELKLQVTRADSFRRAEEALITVTCGFGRKPGRSAA